MTRPGGIVFARSPRGVERPPSLDRLWRGGHPGVVGRPQVPLDSFPPSQFRLPCRL